MGAIAYGGQAVVEGVMMRGSQSVALAVRRPSGEIFLHSEDLKSLVYRSRWSRWPLLRGIVALWDSLILGTRMLMMSANVAVEGKLGAPAGNSTTWALWVSVGIGLTMAIGLFFVVPVLLVNVVDSQLQSAFWSNVVEKAFRLVLLVGYMAGIGLLPDVRRVFAYHGAEHKAINAYESGAALEPDEVARYSTAHPRCGTSFLLIVVVISFAAFLLLGQPSLEWRIASRVVLIPIVAGVAYEAIRLGAAHYGNRFVRMLLWPGMMLQKLTTREPDREMVEVSVAALRQLLSMERAASDVLTKRAETLAAQRDPQPVLVP